MSFNTKVGWNLDNAAMVRIGTKEQWKYLGQDTTGKSKWERNPNFPDAVKADGGGSNYVCCQRGCFALIVNQGPKNEWHFKRNTKSRGSKKTHGECETQDKIENLPKMDSESFIEFAQDLLCLYLTNQNGGKEKFRVAGAQKDRIIPGSGAVAPSITIDHEEGHSTKETYVEIQLDSWINEASYAGGFYEKINPDTGKKWLDQVVFLSFKGIEKGLHYDKRKLPVEIVDQFKRRFSDRKNVRREYEEAKQQRNRNVEQRAINERKSEERLERRKKLAERRRLEYSAFLIREGIFSEQECSTLSILEIENAFEKAERRIRAESQSRKLALQEAQVRRVRDPQNLREALNRILSGKNDREQNLAAIYSISEEIIRFYDDCITARVKLELNTDGMANIETLRRLMKERNWIPGATTGPSTLYDKGFRKQTRKVLEDGKMREKITRFDDDRKLLSYLVELFITMQDSTSTSQ